MRHAVPWAFALAVIATAAPLVAQEAQPAAAEPSIELGGEGLTPLTLTRESLGAFDAVEQDVTFRTSDGERRGLYEGVPSRAAPSR